MLGCGWLYSNLVGSRGDRSKCRSEVTDDARVLQRNDKLLKEVVEGVEIFEE